MDKKSGRATRGSSKSPSRNKKGRPSKSKSPGRPKSPGRKSPARSKSIRSPSESPSRQRSPGRPKRSPVRKSSPGRKASPSRKVSPSKKITQTPAEKPVKDFKVIKSPYVKLEIQEEYSAKLTEPTQSKGYDGEIEVLFIDDNIRFKTSHTNIKFSGKLNIGDVQKVKWEDGNYYDARILNLRSKERSISLPKASSSTLSSSRVYTEESSVFRRSSRLKQNESDKITNVSDTEKILKANNVPQYERKYGEKPVREFGSWLGALLCIIALPVVSLVSLVSCTKAKCSGLLIPSSNWKVYLDLHSAGYYLGYLIWHVLISSLPIGRKASFAHVQVRLMGFYGAILTLAALGGLYYYGFNVTAVLGKSVALLSSAVLFSLVQSLALFVKGGRSSSGRNISADGNKVYDFFIGREMFPTIGPLSIKSLIVRMELVGILLIDALYLLKYIETHAAGIHSPTLLFNVFAHTFYVFDALWFEEKFMTSFEAQYEAVGCMSSMAAATWPFLLTLSTRYIVYTNYEAPTYVLVICGIIYALGYFIYRASNSQKAEFRKNPQHPVFAKYDTLVSIHGKRLLCGGWWGTVRHPNYVGDILMMWSMASVCGLSHWVPYVFPVLHAIILIHRTFRVETRCKNLYSSTWDRYTQLVKHRLIPRVF